MYHERKILPGVWIPYIKFGCSQHTMDQRPKKHPTLTKWMHVTHGLFLHWWHLQNHWRKHLNTNVAHFRDYILPPYYQTETGQTGMDFEHVHSLSAWIFFDSSIHPGKLTWPKNGGGWKMIFQWAIRGCSGSMFIFQWLFVVSQGTWDRHPPF